MRRNEKQKKWYEKCNNDSLLGYYLILLTCNFCLEILPAFKITHTTLITLYIICVMDSTNMKHLQKSGDVVLTLYGVGVIISSHQVHSYDDEGNTTKPVSTLAYKVRLWRQPGKSIASSSIAYLQHNCVSSFLDNES